MICFHVLLFLKNAKEMSPETIEKSGILKVGCLQQRTER